MSFGMISENKIRRKSYVTKKYALKYMLYNKSPGNDGLTKEFQETFWEEIKIPLCDSITRSYQNGELSVSQKQAVIKLIEKKG